VVLEQFPGQLLEASLEDLEEEWAEAFSEDMLVEKLLIIFMISNNIKFKL